MLLEDIENRVKDAIEASESHRPGCPDCRAHAARADQAPDLSREEVAALLGLHVSTVDRRRKTGELRAYRDGGKVLLQRADVEAYRDACGRRDTPPDGLP